MNSAERVAEVVRGGVPDRVPLFLFLGLHGARETGMGIREYFASVEDVVEGQLRLRARYGHDCLEAFLGAAYELEAFGGEVLYREDGPPNAGAPVLRRPEDIERLEPPRVRDAPGLVRTLQVASGLRERSGGEAPILGAVLGPFSLPVIQLGFERYLEVLYERPDLFDRLMLVNEEFSVEWANAQFAAGVNLLAWFDPLLSPAMVPTDLVRRTGLPVMRRTVARLRGPVAACFAAARCRGLVDDLAAGGVAGVVGSALEDLAETKSACRGRLVLFGSLNGVEMRRWTPREAEEAVKDQLRRAGRGGGFILSDSHGEIPWQVPGEVVGALSEAARRWGRYPLDWIDG